MLLVDVMLPRLSVLRVEKIRDSLGKNALGNSSFLNLSEKAKPGDIITVRVERVQHVERGGPKGDMIWTARICWPRELRSAATSFLRDRKGLMK